MLRCIPGPLRVYMVLPMLTNRMQWQYLIPLYAFLRVRFPILLGRLDLLPFLQVKSVVFVYTYFLDHAGVSIWGGVFVCI